ncbi:MAG: histidine--tRNA ligase [Patescibacteria group bacterium]
MSSNKKRPVKFKTKSKEKKKKLPANGREVKDVKEIKGEADGALQKSSKTLSVIRGMRDILPKEGPVWKRLYHTAESIAEAYGYGYIETPIVEDASLFMRSLGRGSDVIEKEMYVFEDKDLRRVALRPEGTASVARAYITHGMQSMSQPVKLWYWGPMFRHDRPQAGRYREFHQFSCEVLGERQSVIDAELIVVAYNYLRDLGIETTVRVNSIGTPADRERYVVELLGYLRSKRSYLPEEIKKRMIKNPLRVLDSKLPEMQSVIEDAPQILDWLGEESKQYFMKVLEYLDELQIPYTLQPTLVRGLDYYTDTVFELYEDRAAMNPGAQEQRESIQPAEGAAVPAADDEKEHDPADALPIALGGGGRYDLLTEQLGGPHTPACGFSLGLERIAQCVRRRGVAVPDDGMPKIFFAQLGEQARRRTLFLIERLRREGVVLLHNLGKSSLKNQLEYANKLKATHALILGQKEVQDGTVIIRDMDSGIQEIVDQKKLRQEIEKILARGPVHAREKTET